MACGALPWGSVREHGDALGALYGLMGPYPLKATARHSSVDERACMISCMYDATHIARLVQNNPTGSLDAARMKYLGSIVSYFEMSGRHGLCYDSGHCYVSRSGGT